jgi:pimeloyl-ACP methyl ester carboxylesterase
VTPETRYARAGDVHIAHQVLGEGPVDVVLADQWFSNMEAQWDVPPLADLRRRLASFSRLIMFDRRGMGLSDPVAIESLPSLDAWMDDLRAVMVAARSERAALIANIGGAITGLVFAASHPDRLSSLVIVDGFARVRTAPDYPAGMPDEEADRQLDLVEPNWAVGSCSTSSRRACGPCPACARPGHGSSEWRRARAARGRSSAGSSRVMCARSCRRSACRRS